MSRSKLRWSITAAAGVLLAGLIPLVAPPAGAGEAPPPRDTEEVSPLEQAKAELTHQLRAAAADRGAQATLYEALAKGGPVDPAAVFEGSKSGAGAAFTRYATAADAWLKDFLGLPKMTSAGFALYLADRDGQLAKGVAPLFAAAPEEDEEATTLVAEDLTGKPVTVDLTKDQPAPLILVSLNGGNVMHEAMYAVSAALTAAGVLSEVINPVTNPPYVSRLDKIRLSDDHEPGSDSWWCPFDLCAAEIFVLAMGGSNGTPRVDVVPLYDVNYSGKDYFPLKTIVNWPNFTWSQVDILIMEKDATACSAPYAKYGTAVAGAITGLASNASYVPLNAKAREALGDKKKICSWPLSYGVNLPDYVDSFNGVSVLFRNDQVGVEHNARTFWTVTFP